ncbi:TPM domain-containing protein [Psychrobacter sp. HD31]|uniref:TPM domain-containing protein n=1 Tax=Psychrobacter sp. HD31 TaxID=3112003 RepID=UPI003DA649FC
MLSSNRLLSAVLLSFGLSVSMATTAANDSNQSNEAIAVASADTTNSASNEGIAEDIVVIGQVAKKNEAVNEAVLGNDALGGIFPEALGGNAGDAGEETPAAAPKKNGEPRTSTAKGVEADKLILNEPVIDEANILSASEKQYLIQRLRSIYEQGKAQAAIVIVPTTNGMDTFSYAMKIADRWQLGEKDTDDGLLILVSINDRDMYILTGYGLEGVLPDVRLKRIIRNDITPYFKVGDYAGGLDVGLTRIEERLNADPEVLAQRDAQDSVSANAPSPLFLFLIAFIFGKIITAIFGRFLGGLMVSGGFFAGSMALGGGLVFSAVLAFVLWIVMLVSGGSGGGKGGRGGGRGPIIVPGGGFGGGGFGSGGFGGGGGGFGGGGAGGGW